MYTTRSVVKRSFHLGFKFVNHQTAVVVERLGKFQKVLTPGLNFLVPFLDRDAYYHSLKEEVYEVNSQMAITKDNVTIHIDGVLYLKVVDPYKASYGIGSPIEAMKQLAQTTMRSELGKLTLDRTFEEREALNLSIVHTINEAASDWGITCMRYEIRDITPPANIRKAMELQAEAERQKRAEILASEGRRQAEINKAEGSRQASILEAEGEAKAIIARANATAESIELLAKSVSREGGLDAVRIRVAEQYVGAFQNLAKENNTMIIPGEPHNIGGMVAQALGIYDRISKKDHLGFQEKPNEEPKAEPKEEPKEEPKKAKYSDPILESSE